jgi:hypothetical protein
MSIILELDEAASKALSELEERTGWNPSRIFSYALSLMLWAFTRRSQGRIVASIDEHGQSYRELEVPAVEQELAPAQVSSGPRKQNIAA